MSPYLVLQIVASLAVVIGAIWLATRLATKHFGQSLAGGSGVSVTSRTPLSRHAQLMVVTYLDRDLLLGVTDTCVTVLADRAGLPQGTSAAKERRLPTMVSDLAERRIHDLEPQDHPDRGRSNGFAAQLAGASGLLRGARGASPATPGPATSEDATADFVGYSTTPREVKESDRGNSFAQTGENDSGRDHPVAPTTPSITCDHTCGDTCHHQDQTRADDASPRWSQPTNHDNDAVKTAPETVEIDLSSLAPPIGLVPDMSIPPPVPAPRHQGLAESWQRTLNNLRDRTVRR